MPGSSKQQPKYHSYSYYRDNFGIYDDDQEIITLTRSDFRKCSSRFLFQSKLSWSKLLIYRMYIVIVSEQSVLNSNSLWFINFYSAMCSHCHTLAPVWRTLAKEMEGVIRFGAVNCEDEWQLCRSLNIRSYPSLYLYPSVSCTCFNSFSLLFVLLKVFIQLSNNFSFLGTQI